MRGWIVTLVLLAGCGSGAAPHAAAPPNRCVASAPGRYEVHRARERLCARLASRGFVVVAPRHADRATPRRLQGPERVEDVLFLLDHLPVVARGAGPPGVLGHAFGGRIAAEVASQDSRVRAGDDGGRSRPRERRVAAHFAAYLRS